MLSQGGLICKKNSFLVCAVDYLKLDGCYNNQSGFVTGYPAMGAALQMNGRNIT